ncbi:MAG: ABC transporter ATP-binding protein, partial [Porticoccaceae bacterium]|nr:ABC transporter ATP-binding protein [Porticoccaceae bacterium]
MFGFFERLVDPFPQQLAQRPPRGVYQFCRHYTRGMEPWLLLMAVLTAITAIAEALLFGILGQVVDWLSTSDPENFVERSGGYLVAMAVFMLVLIPVANGLRSLVVHQTLMGNFPMT